MIFHLKGIPISVRNTAVAKTSDRFALSLRQSVLADMIDRASLSVPVENVAQIMVKRSVDDDDGIRRNVSATSSRWDPVIKLIKGTQLQKFLRLWGSNGRSQKDKKKLSLLLGNITRHAEVNTTEY